MKKTMLAASLVLSLGLASSAFAKDGTVVIEGKITDQTCIINNFTSDKDIKVKLPTVKAASLATANATSGRTPFKIELTGCKASSTEQRVKAFFLPDAAKVNAEGRLINTGTATNVDVQLLNADGTTGILAGENIATQNVTPVNLNGVDTGTLKYNAQYYATAAATAGDVKATVDFNIVYE
ncbi:Major fimbrial subunit precursor [Haemophilus influenzae]|uniref:fimbrial protein n=1 Tax=Haemophilus influenzae TaxID=727 RepID=UPI000D01BADC|nr:fimbrial protein [Haemophilus influenzae]PRM15880.1 Major fimbrial subunit precursor [Haemophilus influenzae]